ncbi:MAG TPA: phosphoglycerate mutase [Bdellovibrionales bacterium]|nr:MAG: hypothetical protein A2Z97_15635 [Bdellovibrionales bacterium GWB1_52_6]OFZ02922.1 MAG: hypothetical protein A2X97_04940 [Bdellovibrionales bacterium GWA1_52_35]OFZ40819.1 MAG: hypothetical protein A2070_13700 [Bdellovibrionales bacterium GWC1_52_8]HAR42829.1 phosphoglycerate mutase [Bdellovibrionales bacterium]HCM38505.1 phosphoglycerate mutase [Bdellovibrionales bacterium]
MVTTTFLLIRHGICDHVGIKLAGRRPGIHLNQEGRVQAEELVSVLQGQKMDAIYSSPLERTRETAGPLARARNLPIQISEAFTEVDYGDWTGRSIEELIAVPEWRNFHGFRSSIQIPGGEFLLGVQLRAVAELEKLRLSRLGQVIVVFSHSDILRSTIMHFLGAPLENLLRIEIPPISITTLYLSERGPQFGTIAQRR